MESTRTIRSTRWPMFTVIIAVLAVGALLAALLRDAGDPPVIRLAAGGGERVAMEADAASPASDLAMWVRHEFVLQDGARFPAGEGTAWRMEPPADLEAQVRDLARRLGIDAEVTRSPHGDDGYIAGDANGERGEPMLWVSRNGEWSYYDPTVMPVVECVMPAEPEPLPADDAETAADDAGPTGEDLPERTEPDVDEPYVELCEAPEPPANMPSAAEARQAAEAFFADLGLPVRPQITETHADEWGAWVSGVYPVGGHLTDIYVNVGLGPDAVVVSANGTLARPVEAGTYPTVDADTAVARLNEGGGYWYGGMGFAGGAVADAPAEAQPATDPDTAVEAPASSPVEEDAPVSILPVPEGGEAETVTVTLVSSEPALVLTMDADGTWWLLPGARFTDTDGGVWPVMTVADEYVQTDDGSEPGDSTEPGGGVVPGDGGTEPGGGVDGREPIDPGEPTPVEPDQGGGVDGSGDPDAEGAERVAHDVVGMTEDEAVAYIEEAGYVARVVARDGESFAVTDDYSTHRINLRVEQGTVVHAEVY